MAHPLKKSERKREEPKLGEPTQGEPKLGEPKLVEPEGAPEIVIAQEFQGESVSDTLIRARQQVGQDLRSIADVLCIRYSYLDAIERGQYENLPGATYAVGFVRSYAEYLGLDGDQVVERFKSEVEGLDSQTKLHFPTPAPEGKMPGGAVFLVAALLFAGAYGVWFYLSNKGESLGDLVAPVPERLQELVGGDAPSTTAENDGTVTVTPAPAAPAAPAAETAPAPAAPAPEAPTQSAALPAAEPAPETPAAPAMATPAEESPAPAEPESALQAPETPVAPAEEAPMAPAAAEESAPAAAADSMMAQPNTPQAAPQAADVSGSAAQSAPQVAVAAPEAPEAPAAASETPASSEPLAIPAAPDNGTPATAFLTNHEPQVYGAENADARIVLKATQDAWVQVRDRQGTLLLTRVLRVGDSYQVPNQDDLTLLTGNAGGLQILVDGRALAPLGPVGAVRRNIPLNPDSLLGGAAN